MEDSSAYPLVNFKTPIAMGMPAGPQTADKVSVLKSELRTEYRLGVTVANLSNMGT